MVLTTTLLKRTIFSIKRCLLNGKNISYLLTQMKETLIKLIGHIHLLYDSSLKFLGLSN